MSTSESDIAIIGMACRFPKADHLDSYWHHIIHQINATTFFSEDELKGLGIPEREIKHPRYIKAKPYLENVEFFDANFFGYSEMEAKYLDPQIRVLLEVAYHALEDAGFNPQLSSDRVSVFTGASTSVEWMRTVLNQSLAKTQSEAFEYLILSCKDFLSQILSYRLNLTGPSYTIYTACSTSLAAVHLACQSLLREECELALAGGVTIDLPVKDGYSYEKGLIHSYDGFCRPFDNAATGTLFGDGAGVVILKKLERAIADRNQIYAVIKGSSCNNDGHRKTGFIAPSIEGQKEVLKATYFTSRLSPSSIDYIETHGTATKIGDPIEFEGLKSLFASRENPCALGSVKANIGHLHAAAGIAGLIKAALSLKHQIIPPLLHFKMLNQEIDNRDNLFYFPQKAEFWKKPSLHPRRAAISSFGVGGTNVHLVIEENIHEPSQNSFPDEKIFILPFSAKSKSGLKRMLLQFRDYMQIHTDLDLKDIAFTLQIGRQAFSYRKALIVGSTNFVKEIKDQVDGEGMRNGLEPHDIESMNPMILVAKQWESGASIDWRQLNQNSCGNYISLPPYPFDKQRLWLEDDKRELSNICSSALPCLNPNVAQKNEQEIAFAVRRLFKETLKISSMSDEDHFFKLGGDSLELIQITSRLSQDFQVEVPLEAILNNPTVTQMILLITELKKKQKI